MSSWPILSLVTFLPLVGALFCMVVSGPKEAVDRNCRSAALITSLVVFVISLVLWARFDPTKASFQFEENVAWVPALKIGYHVGIDGISLFFVLLSTLLFGEHLSFGQLTGAALILGATLISEINGTGKTARAARQAQGSGS